MDTADMPTEYGSPIYRDHRPETDAICVAKVRAAGGVVLGKTVSTEFAHRQPNIQTRNPHDPARTPGGSSSGSAAAVADFMVPLAFGTQTGGSIIRPASYCGVYGYKPTYDTIATAGVKPLAPGLDTVGYFARNLDDIAWFGAALSSGEAIDIPAWPGTAPRVGLTRTTEWSHAEAASVEAVETAAARLDEAGAKVTEVTLPSAFAGLAEAQQTIMCVEAAQALAWERENHSDRLSTPMRDFLDRGAATSAEVHDSAMTLARDCRARLAEAFAGNDVLLTASAQGEAPIGLEWTGDPVFNRNWTLLHVPCVTIPFSRGPNGMPVGVQLVAQPGEHERLLSAAKWIATRLDLLEFERACWPTRASRHSRSNVRCWGQSGSRFWASEGPLIAEAVL